MKLHYNCRLFLCPGLNISSCTNIKSCGKTDFVKGHKTLFMTKLVNQTVPTRSLGEGDIYSVLLCVTFSPYICTWFGIP